MSQSEKFESWALVELFGHQKIVGKVTEATLAGGAFLRVDVPAVDEEKAFTRFYGPGAVYSINPIEESVALKLVRTYHNAPVNAYDLPRLAEKVEPSGDDDMEGTY